MGWYDHYKSGICKSLRGQVMILWTAIESMRDQHNLVPAGTKRRIQCLFDIKGPKPTGNRSTFGRIPDMHPQIINLEQAITRRVSI